MRKTHRGHAIIEQVHADLKGGPLAHLPSGVFTANSAWLILAVIAFNLTRTAGLIADHAGRLAQSDDRDDRDDRDDPPHPHHRPGTAGTVRAADHPAPARGMALADRVQPALHGDPRATASQRELTTAATRGTTENEVDDRDETPGTHPRPQPIRPSRSSPPTRRGSSWIEAKSPPCS